jgi:hypothetical protein
MTTIHLYCGVLAVLLSLPASSRAGGANVGDDRLRITVDPDGGTLRETHYAVAGEAVPGLSAVPFELRINGTDHVPRSPRPREAGPGELAFEGTADRFGWTVRYFRSGPGRVTREVVLTALADLDVEEVTAWASAESTPPIVPRTSLQDIAAIYRATADGLFVSLDFPYSQIVTGNGSTRISYPPHEHVSKGQRYELHTMTFGATHLTGRMRGGHDEGEIAAIDAYVQERFTPRFERPMILSCSIVNRYTQPRGGVVWASMKDHPTLCGNTDLLERELALMPRLGVEHYQVFPGVFDWGPDDPPAAQVDHLMDVARSHGVRMGDYSGTSGLFCPHYNEYGNHLEKPDWRIVGADGKPQGVFCFGCTAFVDHYINTVVPTAKRFGFEMHCMDFLDIQPCSAPGHDHPAGRDSLYAQTRGLVRLLEAINGVSPQMMTWSNSGNWAELLPKIAWANPNLYLTDPFIATPWQGLNMTRLLDDARREQMVSLHNSRFIPYRFLTNCQYFFSQNSIVPDIRNYEYGALSTLAVTPNLCLAEIRPWLDRLSEADRERVIAFYAKWTAFVREHYDLWKTTSQAGEDPGPGAVEVYAHAKGDRGFVFLVNPQYWSRTVDVPLNQRLGLGGTGRCEIAELYPQPRLRSQETLGATVCMRVPAQQVIVLEVRPAPASIDAPRVYGVAGAVHEDATGYLLKTTGSQGRHERCEILIPPGGAAISGAEVRADVPRIVKRLWSPTPLEFQSGPDGGCTLDITFRGVAAPDELREWTVRPGGLDEGTAGGWFKGFDGQTVEFPLFASEPRIAPPITRAALQAAGFGPLAGFCGGYIDNAFAEPQETWVMLRTGGKAESPTTRPAGNDAVKTEEAGRDADRLSSPKSRPPNPLAATAGNEWWLQTRFTLPFMYTIGAEPFFDEHTMLVLPMVDPHGVKRISAWINGESLDVRLYRYPRNRGLGCYYADLVGSGAVGGANTLVVQLTY